MTDPHPQAAPPLELQDGVPITARTACPWCGGRLTRRHSVSYARPAEEDTEPVLYWSCADPMCGWRSRGVPA